MTPFNPLVLQSNLGILSPNLKPVSENSLIEHENGQIQASKVGFELFDIIEKNGEQYEGDWRQDLIDGYGTMYWKNGDRYQGNWRQFFF